MMKKRVLSYFIAVVAICVIGSVAASAQRVPDNEAIYNAINDPASPYYYPSLMLRYENGDTTLTLDDYYYLYYGFAFQDRYKPTDPIHGTDEILAVFERNNNPDVPDALEIIRYAKQVMQQDPFSPNNINYLTYAYGIIGDTINERINADRFDKIYKTIESSGKGTIEKSPWHILWFSHANDLLAINGFEVDKRTIVSRSTEYITVRDNDQGAKGFYFDFTRLYWKKPDDMPEVNKGNGFLLNGIKLR